MNLQNVTFETRAKVAFPGQFADRKCAMRSICKR